MKNWKISYLPHQQTNSFTPIVLDYLQNDEKLQPLFSHYPAIKNIEKVIAAKQKQSISRPLLVKGLQEAYINIEICELVANNIASLLKENTFTICTAHQPNIFTGPLYYIYKILHTIALCNFLKDKYPNYHFVPVYYMGSEDADMEEIGTFFMSNNTFAWKPEVGGAVGRISTSSLQTILQEVCKYIDVKTPQGKNIFTILQKAYGTNLTLSEATIVLVNALFGAYGLIILQPDALIFKQQFVSIMQDELIHQTSHAIVENTNRYIANYYKPQAHSRIINLFYAIGHSKERIEKVGDFYNIVNTETRFTKQEMIAELQAFPERFSPNVILRGVYQEKILPNIVFIGGGGELAYWLQLKDVFVHHKIMYPMIVLRQSISIVNSKMNELLQKLNLKMEHAFLPIPELQKKWVQENNEIEGFTLQQNLQKQLFESYTIFIHQLPPEFKKSLKAHQIKSDSILQKLQTKIIAAFKKKNMLQMQQLEKLRNSFFTNNTLQERKENMIPYYLAYGDELLDCILASILPFGNEFGILEIQ